MASSSTSDNLKPTALDSDSFVDFNHAAAGHDGVQCTASGSMIAKPCTAEEISFYESSALHPNFRNLMPTYIGTLSSEISVPSVKEDAHWTPSKGRKIDTGLSIVLENVASGFKRPNVLDVKLGARLWADDAPPSKRIALDAVAKNTTSSSLGFRIAGMKVWTGTEEGNDEGNRTNPYAAKYEAMEGKGEIIERDGYKCYNKWYGRSFSESNVHKGFETFLAGAKIGNVDRSKLIARRLADALKHVQQVLESEEIRIYSSSVLIIYEGDPEALEYALEEEERVANNPSEIEEEDEGEDDNDLDLDVQDGSLRLADIATGDDLYHGPININIDPETDQLGDLEDEDEECPPKVYDLRLIDFAHATWTPSEGPDENVLMGVRNLVTVFESLDGR